MYRVAFAHHGGHGHTGLAHGLAHGLHGSVGLSLGCVDVLRLTVRKIGTHPGERIGVKNVQRRHGTAKCLGQPGGLGYCQQRCFRTVDRNQNVLEHGASP